MKDILRLKNINKSFNLGHGAKVKASDNISLNIFEGETLGVVGESGCGKSTLARMIMGVYPPDSGEIYFDEAPLMLRSHRARLSFAKKAQMIFQDPFMSLDPRMSAGGAIEENLILHFNMDANSRADRVVKLLESVGLNSSHLNRFPHEFSGGQRQRIGIARALAVNPSFIICDEPVSALDISIQSQIMNLLKGLKANFGLTYMFISHDLNMVRYISDRIAVMYMGNIVEIGSTHSVCDNPRHPYTKILLNAVLPVRPSNILNEICENKGGIGVTVENRKEGCPFLSRCHMAVDKCANVKPQLKEAYDDGHFVACICAEHNENIDINHND